MNLGGEVGLVERVTVLAAGASVTKGHKPGDLNTRSLLRHRSGH